MNYLSKISKKIKDYSDRVYKFENKLFKDGVYAGLDNRRGNYFYTYESSNIEQYQGFTSCTEMRQEITIVIQSNCFESDKEGIQWLISELKSSSDVIRINSVYADKYRIIKEETDGKYDTNLTLIKAIFDWRFSECCAVDEEAPPPTSCPITIEIASNGEVIQSSSELDPCDENTIILTGCGGEQSTDCRVITTGQDDGSNERSRNDGDFFLLAYNNIFGHNRRFTGTTGGYHDGTDYRNANGNLSDFATAFPNAIVLDWNDRAGSATIGKVKAWYIVDSTFLQWQEAKDEIALLTVGGFDWYLPMLDEINFVALKSEPRCFDWLPFGEALGGTVRLWTNTQNPNNSAQVARYDSLFPYMSLQAKIGQAERKYIAVTELNYNGITINQI